MSKNRTWNEFQYVKIASIYLVTSVTAAVDSDGVRQATESALVTWNTSIAQNSVSDIEMHASTKWKIKRIWSKCTLSID